MKKINKKQIYFGVFWVILITSFVFFASLLILIANGYHLNYRNFKLQKTGMMVISGGTEPVDVTLNGKSKTVSLPAKFYQLFPGSYNLTIEKKGYLSIQKSFQLVGGQAYLIDNVNLVLNDIKVSEIVNNEKTIDKIKIDNANQIILFTVKENEIWQNDKLVTRFSRPVIAAIYDSSANQFFVQLSDGIHLILSDGSNDNLIIKLDSPNSITMAINNNILSYIKDTKIFQAQVR